MKASFWIHDPRNLETREYLGSFLDRGTPRDIPVAVLNAQTEQEYKLAIEHICYPDYNFVEAKHGWPFRQWKDDIFLTNYTYAWFNHGIWVSFFHCGFAPIEFHVIGEAYQYLNEHEHNSLSYYNVPV